MMLGCSPGGCRCTARTHRLCRPSLTRALMAEDEVQAWGTPALRPPPPAPAGAGRGGGTKEEETIDGILKKVAEAEKVEWVAAESFHKLHLRSDGRRRDCHSAAPPSTFGRCFNRDGKTERASAK